MAKIKNNKKNLISVIIPAFEQEKTIVEDIIRIEKVLKQLRYDFEMIVVIDGIIDKTFEKARKTVSKNIKVFGYEKNHGKGYAVRYGMVRSRGNIIAFIDSGMDINPNGLSMLLEHFEWYNADIIIGSKRHPVSKINYPWQRKILSFGYQLIVKLLFGLNIRDTQVGLKFFKRRVMEDVLPRLLVKRYAFDIEILAVAYQLGYRRIFEAPVELNWTMGNGLTSKTLLREILNMLWDTLAVFYRLKILRYYNKANKRKWRHDKGLD